MAEPEDLVIIFGDDIARCWKQIIYFNRTPEEAEAKTEDKAEEEGAPAALAPGPGGPTGARGDGHGGHRTGARRARRAPGPGTRAED